MMRQLNIVALVLFVVAPFSGCDSGDPLPVGLRPISPPEVEMRVKDTFDLELLITRVPSKSETILVEIGDDETCAPSGTPPDTCVISAFPNPVAFTFRDGNSLTSTITAVSSTEGAFQDIRVRIQEESQPGDASGVITERIWQVRVSPL